MDPLTYHVTPKLDAPALVMGLTGWMDGGRVSSGAIEELARLSEAGKFAQIDPLEFYILNFPISTMPLTIVSDGEQTVVRSTNPMEQAAIFRPSTEIRKGIVRRLEGQPADFLYSEAPPLVLFSGAEPHIRWRTFAELVFEVVERLDVSSITFVGSVSSPVPHTREPRIRAGYSTAEVRYANHRPGVTPTEYEGPASFSTLMLQMAAEREVSMQTLVVDVPHYPFLEIPAYPASIHRVLGVLCDLLGWDADLSEMQRAAEHVHGELDSLMERNEEFRKLVDELESAYDLEQTADDEHVLRRLIDQIDLGEDG